MILVIVRTLILYLTTLIALRIMGKKQIAQLQPYELVVIIMIAELAAIPMQNTNIPLINGIIPIFILIASEITLSYISLKSIRGRGIICGKPSIIIKNSEIMEDELRRLRYNINDLLEQLRLKNVNNISDVAYAILETSGQLSIILKSPNRPLQPRDMDIFPPPELMPISLIIDGQVIKENLEQLDLGLDWLKMELEKDGIQDFKAILFACLDSQGKFFYQIKS
ncbi:MAG: DUF421 domain-containing protein [Syntrophomonadaceae bacterium]|jgi:uncharacterized membrane protein YcaP (DUF421 family)|nr:DUF421 domain-containing protein [Syntrophomonadaceae bacterium]